MTDFHDGRNGVEERTQGHMKHILVTYPVDDVAPERATAAAAAGRW